MILSIFINQLREAFKEPDPMRFAIVSQPPPNWFGELEGVAKKKKSGPVLVNEATNTFEFGRTEIDIVPVLTDRDVAELRRMGYDPSNPAYSKAKAYFALQPYCTKSELAANSGGDGHPGISANTAKDVLAAFRKSVIEKPSF